MSIFDAQISRKPDLYPWTSDYINAMWAGFWTPNEFSFTSDIHEFKTVLTEEERGVVVRALSAIAQIEVAVKRFWANLGNHLPHPSITDLGFVLAHSEVIHNNAYEKLLTVLGLDEVFQQNLEIPEVKGRVEYLTKHLERRYQDDRKQFVYSLVLFTIFVENVSLFSQFYIISWFNRYKNVLKDTAQQVQYTTKEETLHYLAGVKLIDTIREEHPELFDNEFCAEIASLVGKAYQAESQIIDWILQGYSGENLSKEHLYAYIAERFNDSLAHALGEPRHFLVDPLLKSQTDWMEEEVLGNSMSDFFHKRPVEYSKKDRTFNAEDLF